MMPMKFQTFRVPILILIYLFLAEGIDDQQPKSKRQIYREQVLPSRGGKIPDGAFRTDRLALNRLNKEGIAIPDGVLLEHRLVHSHPHINKHDPEDEAAVIQIVRKEENRFVAAPGKYHHQSPLTVPSTYIIRKPIGPESTVLRTPAQQITHHVFHQNFNRNHNHNSIGTNGYRNQQQFVPQIPQHLPMVNRFPHPGYTYKPAQTPFKKYLPTGPPPQKYLPAEMRPLPEKFLPQRYNPTVIHHPHPYGYEAPISYQSVAYFPIHTPLILPNKELQTNEYYRVKGAVGSNVPSNDIHDVIDWPALLAHYSQVSSKLDALNQETYEGTRSNSQFLSPEVLGSIDSDPNHYSENVGRYVRKSKEIEAGKSEEDLALVRLGCNGEEGNAVGDGSTQCAK